MHKISNLGLRLTAGARIAFTRTELIITLAVLAVLGGMAGMYVTKGRGISKTDLCLNNLREVGIGMAIYEKENSNRLPIGAINYDDHNFVTWDSLIASVIRTDLKGKSPDKLAPTTGDVGKLLLCPADTLPRVYWGTYARPRTYSMPAHSMSKSDWPPGPKNATGVGLNWRWKGTGFVTLTNLATYTNGIPAVKLDMIQEADATIAITERVYGTNLVGASSGAILSTTADQLDPKDMAPELFHDGRFNYLMVDGHAETLSPNQTVGQTGQVGKDTKKHMGMWTIKAGD